MSRLHPLAQQLIDDVAASGQLNAHLIPVDAARERFEAAFASLQKPPMFEIRDVTIPTRDGVGVKGRLYRAREKSLEGIMLYFHGGGWLLGSIDSHDVAVRKIAEASNMPVLSVDYRRGPEHKFPSAVNDCLDALDWVSAVENPLQLESQKKVIVAGDSAGGNLAAAVANERWDTGLIVHQLLIYPVTTLDLSIGFDEEFDGVMLEYDELLWHQEHYLVSAEDAEDPRVSVLQADLTGVPSATVILAECDPIRPQGELYAKALKEAGVDVETKVFAGMIHGFFGLDELFPTAAEAMIFAGERARESVSI